MLHDGPPPLTEDDENEDESLGYKSASDNEGSTKGPIPPHLFFGNEMCRAHFKLKATGAVVHVCGRTCTWYMKIQKANIKVMEDVN